MILLPCGWNRKPIRSSGGDGPEDLWVVEQQKPAATRAHRSGSSLTDGRYVYLGRSRRIETPDY